MSTLFRILNAMCEEADNHPLLWFFAYFVCDFSCGVLVSDNHPLL